ncbi:MAG: hypothetical protein KA346_00155 [Neisseriaceae bacterium]|nr:hypothetical protein [Neisseriaceae bacterium]
MKTRGKTLAPRNPYAVLAKQRSAGAHEKTNKAKRQQAKQHLRSAIKKEVGFQNPTSFLMAAAPGAQAAHSFSRLKQALNVATSI